MTEFFSAFEEDNEDVYREIDLSETWRIPDTVLDEVGTHVPLWNAGKVFQIIDEHTAVQEARASNHRRWAGGNPHIWADRDEVAGIVEHPETVDDPDKAVIKLDEIASHDRGLWVVAETKEEREGKTLHAAPLIGGQVVGNTVNLVVKRRDGNYGRLDLAKYTARVYVQPHPRAA